MTEEKSRFAGLELETARLSNGRGGPVIRDAEYYLREGLAHELGGRHDKALNQYSAALGEDLLCIPAWTRQLWMLLYLDELKEALVWADKALQSFPRDPDILALKSLVLWRNGIPDEAQTLNDTALEATRDSANVWLARGEMQLGIDMKSAMACIKRALTLPGDKGLVQLRAADILFRQRKFAEAVEYYRNATRANPESSWAWYGYGRTQQALGNDTAAVSAFERASAISPRDMRYRDAREIRRGPWERFRKWLGGGK